MKISFVLKHADMSGGVRVVAIYARRLRALGHEVLVVSTPHPSPSLKDRARSVLRARGWPRRPIKPSHLDSGDVEHRVLDETRPVTDADLPDADVVIATWWETAEWVSQLSPSKGAKAYFIQHHEIHANQPRERVEATWRLPMHRITISKWLMDLGRDVYGDGDLSFIPNSVDTDQFNAPPRGRQAEPTVGLLYATTPFKGCAVSFAAVEQARRTIPNLKLIAFGNKPVSPELPLPPNSEYTCLPAQEKIRELYARCDVWLCGSFAEGFHLPPLEAMACRCPVISTRVGGPIDVIEEGVNGHLVDVNDAMGLANRLERVLVLPDAEWKAMSDAAHATATRYSWDDATLLFEAALHKTVEKSRATVQTPAPPARVTP